MKSLTLFSPAKINLYLKISGKRPDGYHNLVTLFQRISLSDTLQFRKTRKPGVWIHCDQPGIPVDASNLIAKAYALVRKKVGLKEGLEVFLTKKIPAGGGLGGGSGNAATTLTAVNQLFQLGLRKGELVWLGRQLGADVAFFVSGASQALGLDRGDRLQPLDFKTKVPVVLTYLPEGISTKSVYSAFERPRILPCLTKLTCDATMLSVFLASKDLEWVSVLLQNDLLSPAAQLKPAIARVLSFLKKRQPASMMSGSGSTLFSLVRSHNDATRLAREVHRQLGLSTWIGTTC